MLPVGTVMYMYTISAFSDMYCEARDVAMTSEQARVVVYPIRKGETIKVIAFAGTK